MKKIIIIMSLCLAMLFSVIGCNNSDKKESVDTLDGKKSNIIEVASVSPLSGNNAAFGEVLTNGANMAVDERKEEFKDMGFKLVLKTYDDQADASVGVSTARNLINEKDVLAVMGHFNSGVAIPSSEVYKEDNLLMMSPANTAVEITERGIKSVNRIVARDDLQGPVAAKFSVEDLKASKIFIVDDKTDYGTGIGNEYKKTVEQLKSEVVGYESLSVGDTDFSGILAKIASKKPDLVFFAGVCPEGPMLLKQMREKGIKSKFLGPDGIDSSDTPKIAKDNVIGIYYTSTAGPCTDTKKGKEWAAKYEKEFNKEPENYAAYGYDAMIMSLDAIKKAIEDNDVKKPTRLQVTNAARELPAYDGIATKVELDEKGDNKEASVFIYKYEKAEYPADVLKTISAKEFKK
ncbi:MAG: branched-chain amino acid ABC transporter substrate-binding protein [Clostridiales bacterium]